MKKLQILLFAIVLLLGSTGKTFAAYNFAANGWTNAGGNIWIKAGNYLEIDTQLRGGVLFEAECGTTIFNVGYALRAYKSTGETVQVQFMDGGPILVNDPITVPQNANIKLNCTGATRTIHRDDVLKVTTTYVNPSGEGYLQIQSTGEWITNVITSLPTPTQTPTPTPNSIPVIADADVQTQAESTIEGAAGSLIANILVLLVSAGIILTSVIAIYFLIKHVKRMIKR